MFCHQAPGRPFFCMIRLWLVAGLYGAAPLGAAELYKEGDIEIRWDNTLRYTAAFRLRGHDSDLLADPNADDGDRNFTPGPISDRVDLLSELDISKGKLGFEASAAAWYDTIYNGRNDNNSPGTFNPDTAPHNEFTHSVQTLMGRDAELLNAFVYDSFDIAGMPFSFRLGRYTLLWGESLFFPNNGIAAGQAPIDEIKEFSLPTAEAKELFMPVGQVSASLQAVSHISIEAYYQFEWRRTRQPGSGSYFSTDDTLDVGGQRLILGPGQYLFRAADQSPPALGQFGVALRWSPGEWDYGLYALRFNAKDPQVYRRPGATLGPGNAVTVIAPSLVNSAIGSLGSYNLVFPQGIETYGASFSGYLGSSNIAGEISGRRNMPLLSKTLTVLPGIPADGDQHPLYPVGDTLHLQVSSITDFPRKPLWDSAELSTEIAANHRLDITRNAAAFDSSRNKLAVIFEGLFTPTYFQVLPNLDLSFPIGLTFGLIGKSSIDEMQNVGAGQVDIGVTATYRSVWEGTLMFTHFIGPPDRQPFADRDFIALSVQRTF
jgi:hypothetical protein